MLTTETARPSVHRGQEDSYLIEHVNINLLKAVSTAELIDLMVDLVVYPCIIIIDPIIQQSIVHMVLPKAVNNLKAHETNKMTMHSCI